MHALSLNPLWGDPAGVGDDDHVLDIAEAGELHAFGNVHRSTRVVRRVDSSHFSLRLMFTPWPAKYTISCSTPAPL